MGSFGTSFQTVSSNVTLDNTSSTIFADTSSGDLTITLPHAGNVIGRLYKVKKSSTSNTLSLSAGANIDTYSSYTFTSGNIGSLEIYSNGTQWYVLDMLGEGIAGVSATTGGVVLLFQDDFESGLGAWTNNGAAVHTSSPKNDAQSAQLQGNEDIEVAVSTANKGNIVVEFALTGDSLDSAGETVEAEWYDGAQWFQMAFIDYDEDTNSLAFYKIEVPHKGSNNSGFKIRFKNNASGTGDYGYVDDVSVTSEASVFEIFKDDFESGLGAWTNNGGAVHTSSPKNDGQSIQIQGNEDIEKAISTSGYGNVVAEFALTGDSLDSAGETVEAEWYDGAQWFQMAFIDYTSDTGNLAFYKVEVPYKGNNNANFKIRFKNNASGTGDYGYIDDVSITGESTITEVFRDDFESGLGAWTNNGGVAHTSAPKNDSQSVQLQGNEDIEKAISTAGYGNVVVEFALTGDSLDSAGETVEAEWYDGAQWFQMAFIDYDEDTNSLAFYKFLVPYKGNNNANFKIRFKNNASGTGDYAYVDDVSITAETSITEIFRDDFESGLGAWTNNGGAVHTSSPKNDSQSIQIQGNEDIEKAISTAGYGNVVVEFALTGDSLDTAGETIEAEWYDGAQWFQMAFIDHDEDTNSLAFYRFVVPYKGNNNANFKIRFKNNASGSGDYGYIDDVSVTGETLSQ